MMREKKLQKMYRFFERRVYFCIKIVLGEKNIDFFCYKEHHGWLGGNAKKHGRISFFQPRSFIGIFGYYSDLL